MTCIIHGKLCVEDVIRVSRENEPVKLSSDARERIIRSRKTVESLIDSGKIAYGVTTGFGKLCDTLIPLKDVERLQENLINSHSMGVGEPFPEDIVRAIILLRINSLALGYSGISLQVVEQLISLLNKHITPYVPSQGSLGASGDLAPLAHIALVLTGKGKVIHKDKIYTAEEILKKKGIKPLRLGAKEGLALINGTNVMTAIGCLAVHDAEILAKTCDISGSLSLDALKGSDDPFQEIVHELRPHEGQKKSAKNLRNLIKGSAIRESHRNCSRIQDAYSLRCMPQVHGAVRDTIEYVKKIIEQEINAVTDNPLVFPESDMIISAGHFHGEPIALAMDFLKIAISELGNISERRINRLLNPTLSELPAFLTEHSGLNSGLMIAQYTAASLVSENKSMSHPASVDSIPVCADQEDHVSMGTISARQAYKIVKNTQKIIALEIICACQALEFLKPLKTSASLDNVYKLVRKNIKPIHKDRYIKDDIDKVINLVETGAIVKAAEKYVKLI